jgi:hypothetical protein
MKEERSRSGRFSGEEPRKRKQEQCRSFELAEQIVVQREMISWVLCMRMKRAEGLLRLQEQMLERIGSHKVKPQQAAIRIKAGEMHGGKGSSNHGLG